MDFKNVIQHVLDCYDNDTEWLAHDKKAAGGGKVMVENTSKMMKIYGWFTPMPLLLP